jgi:hypothetical protein
MGFLRTEHRALIDSVKIVRKRYADAGKMNCLGFATFATLRSAQDFVESKYVCLAHHTNSGAHGSQPPCCAHARIIRAL